MHAENALGVRPLSLDATSKVNPIRRIQPNLWMWHPKGIVGWVWIGHPKLLGEDFGCGNQSCWGRTLDVGTKAMGVVSIPSLVVIIERLGVRSSVIGEVAFN